MVLERFRGVFRRRRKPVEPSAPVRAHVQIYPRTKEPTRPADVPIYPPDELFTSELIQTFYRREPGKPIEQNVQEVARFSLETHTSLSEPLTIETLTREISDLLLEGRDLEALTNLFDLSMTMSPEERIPKYVLGFLSHHPIVTTIRRKDQGEDQNKLVGYFILARGDQRLEAAAFMSPHYRGNGIMINTMKRCLDCFGGYPENTLITFEFRMDNHEMKNFAHKVFAMRGVKYEMHGVEATVKVTLKELRQILNRQSIEVPEKPDQTLHEDQ